MSENIFDKRNDFILFNEETGEAELTPQAKNFEAVKFLDRNDRSKGKIFVKKCVNMIYYLYHKDSPVSHLGTAMKMVEVVNIRDDFKDFKFDNESFKRVESLFIKTHYSRVESRYLSLISDLDVIRDSLVSMPTIVRKKVFKDIKDKDDDSIEHTLEGYIEYDNQLDKVKAVSALINLDKLEKILMKRVEDEYKAERSQGRRMFDQES